MIPGPCDKGDAWPAIGYPLQVSQFGGNLVGFDFRDKKYKEVRDILKARTYHIRMSVALESDDGPCQLEEVC